MRGSPLKGLLLLLLWTLAQPSLSEENLSLEFSASDKSFTLATPEDFRTTFNPHAILSLASLDQVAIVVTKRPAEHSLEDIYASLPRSLPPGMPCLGRMMISVDGEQAAAFVVEGMFPPQDEATHQTLLTVVVRQGQEYNFMVHYPIEHDTSGLEAAYATMGRVRWKR